MLECSKCKTKVRADIYLEDHIQKGNIKDKLVLEGINDEVSKYVELPDGRCVWIMCSLHNCQYPDCELEE